MPGVPSGRGCDGCRKQKKKCDLALPACSRCTRLRIKCVGAGQQRYRFIHHTAAEPAPIRLVPSSATSLVTRHWISRIEVKDIRYDTNCFGTFLRLIPERIGRHPALDMAVDTFATAYSNLHVKHYPVKALVKHGRALKALRHCLKGPQHGQVAELASAIYLTMLNDDLINNQKYSSRASHIEILGHQLRMTAHLKWESPFELEVLSTITGVVIMESAGNIRINLDPWVWKVLETIAVSKPFGPHQPANRDIDRFPSLELRHIVEVVQLVREPADRYTDLQSAYKLLLSDREKLKCQPNAVFYSDDQSTVQPPPQIQLGYQTRRATVLTLSLMVNMTLQEFIPPDISLTTERDVLIEEIISASQIPERYLPLGACYVTHCLIIAYAASCDPKQQKVILGLLGKLCELEGAPSTLDNVGLIGWRSKWEMLRRLVPGRPLLSAAICRHARDG